MAGETRISSPEQAVMDALNKLGWADEYIFQYSVAGGHQFRGGVVIDFFIQSLNLAIEVQGEYYHYGKGLEVTLNDKIKRQLLEGMGITVIYIDEFDALEDADFYVSEALAFRDWSKER